MLLFHLGDGYCYWRQPSALKADSVPNSDTVGDNGIIVYVGEGQE